MLRQNLWHIQRKAINIVETLWFDFLKMGFFVATLNKPSQKLKGAKIVEGAILYYNAIELFHTSFLVGN